MEIILAIVLEHGDAFIPTIAEMFMVFTVMLPPVCAIEANEGVDVADGLDGVGGVHLGAVDIAVIMAASGATPVKIEPSVIVAEERWIQKELQGLALAVNWSAQLDKGT